MCRWANRATHARSLSRQQAAAVGPAAHPSDAREAWQGTWRRRWSVAAELLSNVAAGRCCVPRRQFCFAALRVAFALIMVADRQHQRGDARAVGAEQAHV